MIKAIPAYWYNSLNFGDLLTPYLVEKITGIKAVHVYPSDVDIEHIAITGSIIEIANHNTHIWGLGTAHHNATVNIDKEKVHAVRGRLTQDICEIDEDIAIGDPAMLLPRFFNPKPEKKYRLGIIPHVMDRGIVSQVYSRKNPDVLIIDLAGPIETVITQICQCEATISSALHGLITSHAYGVPCRWVEFTDVVIGNGFKFLDYFTTVETMKTPLDLRTFPDISGVLSEIPTHRITADLDKLMNSCPIK